MLLREQFRVGRIELQQLLYIFQLRLCTLDVLVDTFQCLGQLGGITADFYSDALDSVCHADHLLREGMKKAPAGASALKYYLRLFSTHENKFHNIVKFEYIVCSAV